MSLSEIELSEMLARNTAQQDANKSRAKARRRCKHPSESVTSKPQGAGAIAEHCGACNSFRVVSTDGSEVFAN